MANNRSKNVFYQELLDLLKIHGKDELKLLIKLSIAVEKKQKSNVIFLVKQFTQKYDKFNSIVNKVSENFYKELMLRMLFFGFIQGFEIFREWYKTLRNENNFALMVTDEREVWMFIIDRVLAFKLRGKYSYAMTAWKQQWWTLYVLIRDFIKYEFNTKPVFGGRRYLSTSRKANMVALFEFIDDILISMQYSYQIMLEHSLIELEKTVKPVKIHRLMYRLFSLKDMLLKNHKKIALLNDELEVTRAIFRLSPDNNEYKDFFTKRKTKSRTIEFTFYDREGDIEPVDNKLSVVQIIDVRSGQLKYLYWLYGIDIPYRLYEKTEEYRFENIKSKKQKYNIKKILKKEWKNKIDENKSIRERINRFKNKKGNNGKFKFRTNTDIIKFLQFLFEDLNQLYIQNNKNNSTELAWKDILSVLNWYFINFSAHTKYNIREKGKNYLDITFPRSMTGRVLHDCGVYAVRFAYILSKVAYKLDRKKPKEKQLKLKIRFIVLPLHVGLIVTGENIMSLMTHNYSMILIDNEIQSKREIKWINTDEYGKTKDPPERITKDNEKQFWAEMSAPYFISHVKLPYLINDVLEPGKKPTKRKIWKSYRDNVIKPGQLFREIINDKKIQKTYQFDLKYLKIILIENKWYNKFVLPFWNITCFSAWNIYGQNLIDLDKIIKNPNTSKTKIERANKKFKTIYNEYYDYIYNGKSHKGKSNKITSMKVVEKAYNEFVMDNKKAKDVFDKNDLNESLANNPKILKNGIKHTWPKRLNLPPPSLSYIDDYFEELQTQDPQNRIVKRPVFSNPVNKLFRLPE